MKVKTLVLYVLGAVSVLNAEPVILPNTFSAGTPAKASEVNANFTTLANAVNSLSNPLMVYDSNGKVVGQYLAHDQGGSSVIISSVGGPFQVEIDIAGFSTDYEFPFTTTFYASVDCSGTPYWAVYLNSMVPNAYVVGTNAFILDPVTSAPNFLSRKDGNQCSVLNSPPNYSHYFTLNRIVSLAGWSPPFSVK